MVKKIQATRRAKRTVSRRKHSRETIATHRPHTPQGQSDTAVSLQDIADLIGSVEGLPSDLAANHKKYLKAWGYGRKRRPE